MTNTQIRRMRETDIPFALEQTDREGWDSTAEHFLLALALDPEGCFLAERNGQPHALITATRHGTTGWIGHLIVVPVARRQGLGEAMMTAALNFLDHEGIKTVRLEADPDGVSLYLRLGFRDEFLSPRFLRTGPTPPPGQDLSPDSTLRPTTPADLDGIASLDRLVFGDDRRLLLQKLLDLGAPGHLIEESGRVTGYLLVQPSRLGRRLGPWVASDANSAAALLRAGLQAVGEVTTIVALPAVNQAGIELLQSDGFRNVSSCRRMVLGRAGESAGQPEQVFGLANGAMG